MAKWLQEVNWDSIGKTANSVTSAASAISAAADTLNKNKVTNKTVTLSERSSTSGGESSSMLLVLAGLLLFGKKLF